MCEVTTLLERELNNTGLIYIYKDEADGKWYVYERSAFYLGQLLDDLPMERYVVEGALWFVRGKVDMERIPPEAVISRSNKECVLTYTPHNGFQEWLATLE